MNWIGRLCLFGVGYMSCRVSIVVPGEGETREVGILGGGDA